MRSENIRTLHAVDPAVDEHDGEPWGRPLHHVTPERDESVDVVADMVADLCAIVFNAPMAMLSLRPSVRRLVLERLTGSSTLAYEFNQRMRAAGLTAAGILADVER